MRKTKMKNFNEPQNNLDMLNYVTLDLEGTKNYTNPSEPLIKKYITFSANVENAGFYYFDKEEGVKKSLGETIKIIPLQFMSSVGGYSEEDGYITSSLFLKKTDKVTLFQNRKRLDEMSYEDLKTNYKGEIEYQKEIFGLLSGGEIVRITLRGSGLSGWINLLNNKNIFEKNLIGKLIEISTTEKMKSKNGFEFKSLTISGAKVISQKHLDKIKDYDIKLSIYLNEDRSPISKSKDDNVILTKEEAKELKEMKKSSKNNSSNDENDFDAFFK